MSTAVKMKIPSDISTLSTRHAMMNAQPSPPRRLTLIFLLASALFSGCSLKYVVPLDGLYDSQMPAVTTESRRAFDRLLSSTVRVTWTPEYRTTHYAHDLDRNGQPVSDPSSPTGFRLVGGEGGISQSRDAYSIVGTGLLLSRRATGMSLDGGVILTAAHVVSAPDTVRAYLWDSRGRPTGALASISVKVSGFVFVTGQGGGSAGATVRRVDKGQDLALLTVSIPTGVTTMAGFGYRIGNGAELDWGNFVYLIGYPHGQAQMTWGIVSRGEPGGAFTVDATVNFGYSGGPVLAVRDGLPNLELVGICRGASVNKFRYLAPNDLVATGARMTSRMIEDTLVKEMQQVEYGTAFIVPVEVIRPFVLSAREIFAEKGIDVLNDPSLRNWGF